LSFKYLGMEFVITPATAHLMFGQPMRQLRRIRERHAVWLETICGEVEPQGKIGAEDYYVTSDGLMMPARKDKPPPRNG
jgi:hypothetical protein